MRRGMEERRRGIMAGAKLGMRRKGLMREKVTNSNEVDGRVNFFFKETDSCHSYHFFLSFFLPISSRPSLHPSLPPSFHSIFRRRLRVCCCGRPLKHGHRRLIIDGVFFFLSFFSSRLSTSAQAGRRAGRPAGSPDSLACVRTC